MSDATTNPSTSLKSIADRRSDLFWIHPDLLHVKDGWNSRDASTPENIEHIESLAESIKAVGVQMPLTVSSEKGVHYVMDGHCRLAAIRLAMSQGAEIKSVPVQVEDRRNSEADRIVGQIIRNSGKGLTPLEQANVFHRLIGLGWTEGQIAEKVGKTRVCVSGLLDLRAGPVEIVEAVRKGEVSASLAHSTIREAKGDGEAATMAVRDAVAAARAEGKTKATPKHFREKKPSTASLKDLVKKVLDSAEVHYPPLDPTIVSLTISVDDWNSVRAALGITENVDA